MCPRIGSYGRISGFDTKALLSKYLGSLSTILASLSFGFGPQQPKEKRSNAEHDSWCSDSCVLSVCRYNQAPYVIHVNFYSAKVDNVYFPQVRPL
jgi:hypothetical protein